MDLVFRMPASWQRSRGAEVLQRGPHWHTPLPLCSVSPSLKSDLWLLVRIICDRTWRRGQGRAQEPGTTEHTLGARLQRTRYMLGHLITRHAVPREVGIWWGTGTLSFLYIASKNIAEQRRTSAEPQRRFGTVGVNFLTSR